MRKFILLLSILCVFTQAKIITDMMNNKVEVADNVTKTLSASPPLMALLYALTPDTMVGINYEFLEMEKRFMLPSVQKLPVVGGFFGEGRQANIEKIISLRPDVVFVWNISDANNFIATLKKFGIPSVQVSQFSLGESIEAIELVGKVIGKEERANTLAKYAKEQMAAVNQSVRALKGEKKRVYFAQGQDGLTTECEGDMQSEIISLAGGVNVHSCSRKISTKREKITMEKLYTYNPDIIFVREKNVFYSINDKSLWRNLKAYKEGQIYLTPSSPFAWLSRPPSFMRFLGLAWMHNKMYPNHFEFDEIKETQKFYSLFLHMNLTNDEVSKLLKGE